LENNRWKNVIKKLKRPFELTPVQLKYAEEELEIIFNLKNGTRTDNMNILLGT